MAGRELIVAATIRAQVKQIEELNAITNTFRIKYNCLPGDCLNNTSFGFDTLTYGLTCSLGDGAVNSSNNNSYETWIFWRHLYQAGLSSFTGSTGTDIWVTVDPQDHAKIYPAGKFNTSYIVVFGGVPFLACEPDTADYTPLDGNYIAITGTNASYVRALTPMQQFILDSKIDDGLPKSGRMVAQHNYYGPIYVWDSSGSNDPTEGTGNQCVNNSTTPMTYNVQYPGLLCDAKIKAGF